MAGSPYVPDAKKYDPKDFPRVEGEPANLGQGLAGQTAVGLARLLVGDDRLGQAAGALAEGELLGGVGELHSLGSWVGVGESTTRASSASAASGVMSRGLISSSAISG